MLQNAILSGTWPRSRTKAPKNAPSDQWNISYRLQKPKANHANHRRVVESQKDKEPDFLDGEDSMGDDVKMDVNTCAIGAPKLTYDLLCCDSPVAPRCRSHALSTEDFLGASFDSCTSFGDVFGSLETVTEASNLSLFTEAGQVERYLADLKPRKISVDSYTDFYRSQDRSSIFDYDFGNGSLHGSFSNVSVCAVEAPRAYGVRDLRSETNLNKLKEHIIYGQQYKDCNENYLSTRNHTKNRKLNRLSRSESNLTDKARDILIPLNSGYIAYEKRLPKRKPRFMVFSSKEEITTDLGAWSMDYYESLSYLKLKDIESCRVAGPGVANGAAGRRTTFYIFTEKEKTSFLKVYITGPRLIPPKYELTSLAECFYSVSYLPDRVGWYSVNVLWHGKHVIGSPFRVLMLLPKQKVWFKSDVAPDHQTSVKVVSLRKKGF